MHVSRYAFVCMNACTCACMYVCICVCVYVCMHVCMYVGRYVREKGRERVQTLHLLHAIDEGFDVPLCPQLLAFGAEVKTYVTEKLV